MHQHKLDEDGLASSYLVLTTILPITCYLVYLFIKKTPMFLCKCKHCLHKIRKPRTNIIVFLCVLVLIISMLLRNIFTIKIKTKELSFDPYNILKTSPENTPAEIKKSYRKLLRIFSKKLNSKKTKAMAEESLKNINKAYSILKDPKSLDTFLNDTSASELLIALPSFLLTFSTPFLIFYIALIALAVPFFFLAKHKNFKKVSLSGSQYLSNELFLEEVENLSDTPSILIQQIFIIISRSQEFTSRNWVENLTFENITEDYIGYPLVSDTKEYKRLVLFLSRKLHSFEDQAYITESSINLITSYKKIALQLVKPKIIEILIVVEKLIIQGILTQDMSLAQYPNISLVTAVENLTPKDTFKKQLRSDKELLTSLLSDSDLAQSLKVFEAIPVVSIQELQAFTFKSQDTENTEKIDILTLKPTRNVMKENDCFLIPKDTVSNLSFDLICKKSTPICHCPFSNVPIYNKWYIFTTFSDTMVGGMIILDQFEGKKNIQFNLPCATGKHPIKVHIMSNGYFGNDIVETLNIKYV